MLYYVALILGSPNSYRNSPNPILTPYQVQQAHNFLKKAVGGVGSSSGSTGTANNEPSTSDQASSAAGSNQSIDGIPSSSSTDTSDVSTDASNTQISSDSLSTIATSDTSSPTSTETVSAAPTTVKKYDTTPSSSSALFHFAFISTVMHLC